MPAKAGVQNFSTGSVTLEQPTYVLAILCRHTVYYRMAAPTARIYLTFE